MGNLDAHAVEGLDGVRYVVRGNAAPSLDAGLHDGFHVGETDLAFELGAVENAAHEFVGWIEQNGHASRPQQVAVCENCIRRGMRHFHAENCDAVTEGAARPLLALQSCLLLERGLRFAALPAFGDALHHIAQPSPVKLGNMLP